ncbi:hypothetical protein B0A48_08181 [Cryoendolithus antarcticus]|uniref:C-CAP/cofactor C-like domain-containing protein n=1 Tax=Cryoendolithus antarcticus TaxID=1507870 RepID=A0A1V8T1M9_9PEZI|nr:hypothetical protein B0A48_08181 [Cryoendolithus antarcticus]
MPAMATDESEATQLSPSERFFRYFQHEVTALQDQMLRLDNTGISGGERADAADHCLAGIARLSNEVKDASSYIPAYDQRTYSEAIKALSKKLEDSRQRAVPKQKFSFRSSTFTTRKNESAISLNDATKRAKEKFPDPASEISADSSFATTPIYPASPAPELVQDGDSATPAASAPSSSDAARARTMSFSQSTKVTINNHDGQHIILPSSASHATSLGTLSNLRGCVIDMSTPTSEGHAFAGLTLKNISDSLIICGHVDGAAHATNVTNSILVVASRQLRLHESQNCDVYLHAAGRPIIEDCKDVHFAPLPEIFLNDADRMIENQWDAVDDFKWLSAEPSPNWQVLEEDKRVPAAMWQEVVPGGPAFGAAEILNALKVGGA